MTANRKFFALMRLLSAGLALAMLSAVEPVFAQGMVTVSAPMGSLSGTVYTDSGDVPIANAEVVFTDLKLSARSDSRGNFKISSVPPGPHALTVRLIGYEPYVATMTFRISQQVEAEFLLKPIVTKLAKVNVKAPADPRYAIRLYDFEERRKNGAGRFLTADVFEKAEGQNMSQVLITNISGIRTIGKSSKQVLESRRGKPCVVQVIVNGMVRYNGREEEFDINSLYTGQVIGVEYYTVATTPPMYNATGSANGGSQCGTIIIWTKG